jgi:hypothetical protein
MIEMIAMICATMLIGMVKTPKKPLFGQLTLTGEKALDWLKNGDEIIAKTIWFCNVSVLHDWNVPEWAKDKGIVALIFPSDEWGNPMFITQKSVLRVLEARCADWELKGARCEVIGSTLAGQKTSISFDENHPTLKFTRPENCKPYDPYLVEVSE